MKLVFRKNDQEEISVLQSFDGDERAFVYADMIKALIDEGKLEAAAIDGDFTPDETRSITNMVDEINKVVVAASRVDSEADSADAEPPL